MNWWDSVWIAIVAAGVLNGIYRTIEWRWPEKYMGLHQTFGLSSQETVLRFSAYRAVPVFVIGATCAITVERVGGFAWLSSAVIFVLAVGTTHVRVVWQNFSKKWGEANYALAHIAMTGALAVTLVLATLLRSVWAPLVPQPSELLSAFWGALVAVGAGGAALHLVRNRRIEAPRYDIAYLIERAEKDVGIDVLDWLFDECKRTGADPILLKAILVVEALQRPRWARAVERCAVRLGVARTSGVMQMRSVSPLSDRASVTLAAELYAKDAGGLVADSDYHSGWRLDGDAAWSLLSKHNGDISFIDGGIRVASHLLEAVPGVPGFGGEIQGPLLELRRISELYVIRGISSAKTLRIFFEDVDRTLQQDVVHIEGDGRAFRAWDWAFDPRCKRISIFTSRRLPGVEITINDGTITHAETVRMRRYLRRLRPVLREGTGLEL